MNYGPSPLGIERSLLQKAVRRGNTEIVEKVINYLRKQDDIAWLKKRLVLMTYEECWTYADKINTNCKPYQLLEQYKTLATTVKNKNASGLADLAVNKTEWKGAAAFGNRNEQSAIDYIINAMDRPEAFWNWIKSQSGYSGTAENAMSKASFPGDKAMIFAAAYLSVKEPTPETRPTSPDSNPDFPYWVAFDKHTEKGRVIYIEACNRLKLDAATGMKLASI